MIMKKAKAFVTRYVIGEWYIDIVETKDQFEAWLTHKSQGVSDLMFGSPKLQHTKDGEEYKIDNEYFCSLVEANMIDYMKIYIEEHSV